MGWCRLKIAGVEHCGLCGLAHMGHGRTCPHLNDEKQVETLLLTLKESTESRELIDEATKYLRVIRGDLVSQRRARERRAQQEREAQLGSQLKSIAPKGASLPNGAISRPAKAINGVGNEQGKVSSPHGAGALSLGANSNEFRHPIASQQQPARNGV